MHVLHNIHQETYYVFFFYTTFHRATMGFIQVIAEETRNNTGKGKGGVKKPKGTGVATYPIHIQPPPFTQPGVEHIKATREEAVARAKGKV